MKNKTNFFTLIALSFAVISLLTAVALADSLDEIPFPPRVNPGRLKTVRAIRNPVPADAQSVASGKEIYAGKGICAQCHGDTGKGNGPSGVGFDPRPRDFTNPTWQKARTDGEIFVSINEGTQFGMMAYANSLTDDERWDLVNYIRTLVIEEDFPPRINPGRLPEIQALKNPLSGDSKSIALGKEIFFGKGICVSCHGEQGRGDGPNAASFDPGPRDFTNAKWQKLRTDGEIFFAIHEGTQFGMVAFGESLSEKEIWGLVNYLRTLKKGK